MQDFFPGSFPSVPTCESPSGAVGIQENALSREATIRGCWVGKSIGGTLGLPAEGRMERLNFSYYDPVPTIAPPNDDLELQLVWLHLVEKSPSTLTKADFARAWLDHIHYMWDEYGRCRWNLRRGVPLEAVGTFENPFHAGMGSAIRSEIWACLFPGDPDSAAHYAALDASMDHGLEGIASEVLFAVMQNAVASGIPLGVAIKHALSYIPSDCETARAVQFVQQNHRSGKDAWTCWTELVARHGNENFTHAPLNVALTVWALWYGEGDFEKTVLLAVNGGYDTDCTAASAGATLGLILGPDGIPTHWTNPLGEGVFVGPGIQGIEAPSTFTELTARTAALIGKLEPRAWDSQIWQKSPGAISLTDLPGSLELTPLGTHERVLWANGELPIEVKKAGGARWRWHHQTEEPREIICAVRGGARLFLNDELVLECPRGVAYLPATHRSGEGTYVTVSPGTGIHDVRLELNVSDPQQEASVILAYPNLHLCPWTKDDLPDAAVLPPFDRSALA